MNEKLVSSPSVDQEHKPASTKSRLGTIALIVAILIVALSGYLYLWCIIQGQPLEKIPLLGQVGDAMGPLTGFFSTLALGAAIWSVLIQRRELELQREEMRLIRLEHQESREVMQKQEAAQAKQAELLEKANKLTAKANSLTAMTAKVNLQQTRVTMYASINQAFLERNRILFEKLSP